MIYFCFLSITVDVILNKACIQTFDYDDYSPDDDDDDDDDDGDDGCGFESHQGLWILSYEEVFQLAYGT